MTELIDRGVRVETTSDAAPRPGDVSTIRPRPRAAAPPPTPRDVWRLAWRVSQHRRREFWIGSVAWIVFFVTPALSGFLLGLGYDAIANGNRSAATWLAVAVALSETLRMAIVHYAAIVWTRVWIHMQSLLRGNMLAAQMASGGPEAGQPVGSAGGAITHFRDDAEDVANFVDINLDVTGALVFTAVAGFLLASTDVRAAAVLILPLVAVAVATRVLDGRIKRYRAADREATAEVTGLLGDIMAAATTVKVNGAVDPLMRRLGVLVERRRHTAVRDRVLDESVHAFSQGVSDVGLGLVLVVGAGALASGSFAVGELALFVAYIGHLAFLPRMVGRLLSRRKHAAVAFDRMRQLVAERDAANTVRRRDLPIDPRDGAVRPQRRLPRRRRLERLELDSVSVRYPPGPDGDEGFALGPLSFSVERGQFVVVTGSVGSGKSTLLRALLGLAWDAEFEGTIRWNGDVVGDRGAFFVPPIASFLPQVPQLISDSVAHNVALGPIASDRLDDALRVAAVDLEIAEMVDGVDTLIGPRGLRLSGGQRQRVATARALVHRPELLVIDDVSSALDVETETELWDNLARTETTVIAVSHRAVALERADLVIGLSACPPASSATGEG